LLSLPPTLQYVTVYDRLNSRVGFAEAAANCGDKE
jgi:hypothetical protein